MIHYYYGDGKGKTTAALGLGLRACGAGQTAVLLQLLKDNRSAERAALAAVPGFTVLPGPDKVPFTFQMTEAEKQEAVAYWQAALEHALSLDCGLLILDEAMDAVQTGLIPRKTLLSVLQSWPQGRELVLTGHLPDEAVFALCDYVTEFQKQKHPFDLGAEARLGIEY